MYLIIVLDLILALILLESRFGWSDVLLDQKVDKAFNSRISQKLKGLNSDADVDADNLDLKTRSFLVLRDKHWPGAIVPAVIDPSFSRKQRLALVASMITFKLNSCIMWVNRKSHVDYVKIVHHPNPQECSSGVGRIGGEQEIYLGDDCFNTTVHPGAILHEMMHTLGFIHEQQRIDRNCFVRVEQTAIYRRPDNYKTKRYTDIQFPYDFNSIMQYRHHNVYGRNNESVGNFRGVLTYMDKLKLNYLYCGVKTYCQLHPEDCDRFHYIQSICLRIGDMNL